MPDPNRKKRRPPSSAIVLEREEICWEMRLENRTYQEIADRLGITKQGAWKISERVERKARKRFEAQQDRIRSKQFGQQEKLIGVAFKALGESIKPRTQVTEKEGDDGQIQKTTQVVEQAADVKYGYFILKAQAEIRALCGLNIDPAQNASMTIADVARDMRAKSDEHRARKRQERLTEQTNEAKTTDRPEESGDDATGSSGAS